MENEELTTGDLASQESSQLGQENLRDEGTPSWDEISKEPEGGSEEDVKIDVESEDEAGDESEIEVSDNEPEEDYSGEDDEDPEPDNEDPAEEEEEEIEQKNTLSDESPRVLSFKDYFNKN